MEQSSWEASQEISHTLWNPTVDDDVYKSILFVSILSQMMWPMSPCNPVFHSF